MLPKVVLGIHFRHSVSIIVLIVIYCAVADTPKSWWNPSKAVFTFQVAMWSFSFYATFMIIIKATLTVINLRRLFIGKKLSLHPFHPDGCSGLGILTKYAIKFTRLIVVSGIMLVIWEYWLLRSADMFSFYAFLIHLGFIVYNYSTTLFLWLLNAGTYRYESS